MSHYFSPRNTIFAVLLAASTNASANVTFDYVGDVMPVTGTSGNSTRQIKASFTFTDFVPTDKKVYGNADKGGDNFAIFLSNASMTCGYSPICDVEPKLASLDAIFKTTADLVSWSITDGVHALNNTNATLDGQHGQDGVPATFVFDYGQMFTWTFRATSISGDLEGNISSDYSYFENKESVFFKTPAGVVPHQEYSGDPDTGSWTQAPQQTYFQDGPGSFRVSAVPEPSEMILMLIGLGLVGVASANRRV